VPECGELTGDKTLVGSITARPQPVVAQCGFHQGCEVVAKTTGEVDLRYGGTEHLHLGAAAVQALLASEANQRRIIKPNDQV